MPEVTYYGVKVVASSADHLPLKLFDQVERDEVFFSPSTHLAGGMKMACIENRELAERLANICEPICRKRYGAGSRVEVVAIIGRSNSVTLHSRLLKRIERDSQAVREKLDFLPKHGYPVTWRR